jgi:hypothetical protein
MEKEEKVATLLMIRAKRQQAARLRGARQPI